MSFLNLGIVAHVDAGKTSLTERLLHEAGVLDAPGRVDDGTTVTDSMELERRRGITIRAAVTAFTLGDLAVTLIDTPGHPDFIAEVERSLMVLDAAVLVVSAVEGVQPQTVVIWRALRRLGVPTLLFINKIDRPGADLGRVVEAIRTRLDAHVVILSRTHHAGHPDASVESVALLDPEVIASLAEVDDDVLTSYVEARRLRTRDLACSLRESTRAGLAVPVLTGSALTGAGLDELRLTLRRTLPRATAAEAAPAAATVFAVDHDDHGRRAWVRLWSGEIRVRDRVSIGSREPQLVTGLTISQDGETQSVRVVRAGQVAALRGPTSVRIGDELGTPPRRRTHRFAPPTLQALVEPVDPARRTAMFAGLSALADEDPLIALRLDPVTGEAAVSLHGEVQKEVIAALLDDRFGVPVRFLPTSTVCLERVVGSGSAIERIKVADNPYLATIGLRVEAAPVGHGVEFSPGIERGNLPPAFIAATEEGVRAGLQQGLSGWEVTDCVVTMTESGYWPRQSRPHQKFDKSISSVAADFRRLAPVVLFAALRKARTQVCLPIDRFELDLPDTAIGPITALLGRLDGFATESTSVAGHTHLVGQLPTAAIPDLTARLPDLTGGEGLLVTQLDHHAPGNGTSPTRPRRGPDPLDRETWFRDVPR